MLKLGSKTIGTIGVPGISLVEDHLPLLKLLVTGLVWQAQLVVLTLPRALCPSLPMRILCWIFSAVFWSMCTSASLSILLTWAR